MGFFQLSQWDLRMQRVVLQYLGHSNEYTRIPFKVDQNESIVYAGKSLNLLEH